MPIPPPPPFWPEKATEWVALIGGLIGGILAPSAFLLSILNFRRDRAKIKLRLRPYMHVTAPQYLPKHDYLILQVWNEGRREVQISRADGTFYDGTGFAFADPLVKGAPVLSEKAPEATFVLDQDLFRLDDVWFFSVAAPIRESRVYVHPLPRRWFRALRSWPQRIRARRTARRRRKERLDNDQLLIAKPPR